jgi:hypothetical protein
MKLMAKPNEAESGYGEHEQIEEHPYSSDALVNNIWSDKASLDPKQKKITQYGNNKALEYFLPSKHSKTMSKGQ